MLNLGAFWQLKYMKYMSINAYFWLNHLLENYLEMNIK